MSGTRTYLTPVLPVADPAPAAGRDIRSLFRAGEAAAPEVSIVTPAGLAFTSPGSFDLTVALKPSASAMYSTVLECPSRLVRE